MKSNFFSRFFLRFRYPVSLPEDVAKALGIKISNYLTFEEFVAFITGPQCLPTKLVKYMPRELAEAAFKLAPRKEKFRNNSQFSFYFNEGWLEFILHFDDDSRLRRLYILHKQIQSDLGFEIRLNIHSYFTYETGNRSVQRTLKPQSR